MCMCLLFVRHTLEGARAYSSAFFGQGSGTILMAGVFCNGTEAMLTNCRYDPKTGGCHHGMDAGVRCTGES